MENGRESRIMSRQPHNEEELVEASKHLAYEMKMLLRLGKCIEMRQNNPDQRGVRVEDFALLESFLLHGRNLRHFLFADRGERRPGKFSVRPTDVLAVDYNPEWDRELDPVIEEWMKCVHWRVAHLSYERLSVEDGRWPVGKIAHAFQTEMKAFLVTVDDTKLHPEAQKLRLTIWDIRLEFDTCASTATSASWSILDMTRLYSFDREE